MEATLTYSCDADQLTARQAAERFASSFFEAPRKVRKFVPGGSLATPSRFMLANGVATYEVRYVPAQRLRSVARFEVWRLSA